MKRKYFVKLLLLTLIMCFTLTGCSLSDSITKAIDQAESKMANAKGTSILNKISEDNQFSMSAATKERQKAVLDASNKLASAKTTWNPFAAMFDDTKCMPWNTKKQETKLSAKRDKANDAYVTAKSNDKVFQDSKKSAEKNERNAFLQKYGLFIAIGIGALLLLIILLVLKSRRKVAPAPVAAEAPVPQNIPSMNRTDLIGTYENQKKKFKSFCESNSINYDEAVDAFGDSTEALSRAQTKLSYQVKHGDKNSIKETMELAKQERLEREAAKKEEKKEAEAAKKEEKKEAEAAKKEEKKEKEEQKKEEKKEKEAAKKEEKKEKEEQKKEEKKESESAKKAEQKEKEAQKKEAEEKKKEERKSAQREKIAANREAKADQVAAKQEAKAEKSAVSAEEKSAAKKNKRKEKIVQFPNKDATPAPAKEASAPKTETSSPAPKPTPKSASTAGATKPDGAAKLPSFNVSN